MLAGALVAGCGGGSGPEMARVGDTVITEADVAALFDASFMPVNEDLRGSLFRLTGMHVLAEAMEAEFGVTIDEEEVEEVTAQTISDIEDAGISIEQALQFPNAGEGMVEFNVRLQLLQTAVMTELLTDPVLLDALFADGVAVTTVCSSHILVETETELLDVMERLDAGEDFAEIADEVSLDPGDGGYLGCELASFFVDSFALAALRAPLDEPYGPVQSQFGYHVILVTERTTLDRAVVEADPLNQIPIQQQQEAWTTWVSAALEAAEVEVEPRFGTWTPTGITPPQE